MTVSSVGSVPYNPYCGIQHSRPTRFPLPAVSIIFKYKEHSTDASCPSFCGCDKHHDQKRLGDFNPTLRLLAALRDVMARAQDRNLETGTKAEILEEWYLLACYLQLAQLYIP